MVSYGLVVCNGDVTGTDQSTLNDCVILCTGDVALNMYLPRSIIIAGGDIKGPPEARHAKCVLRPKEKKLGEFLKLYDTAAEGMAVAVEEKRVTVTKVDAAKPFARAGIRTGDRVLRVNDTPVSDLRGLNKALCKAEVGYPGTALVAVVRGDKVLELTVTLADKP